jgi:hypothetical protein
MKKATEILKILLLFIMVLILFVLVTIESLFAYEIEDITIPLGMWSIHSNAENMNEVHKPQGFCVGHFCHMKFINSFGDIGQFDYIDGKFSVSEYGSGWTRVRVSGGFRFGFIWGYYWEPVVVMIPYFSTCYLGLNKTRFCLENSTIPAIDGSNHYLTVTLFSLELDV